MNPPIEESLPITSEPSSKDDLQSFKIKKPFNKNREIFKIGVVRAWVKRHVDDGDRVIVEENGDEFIFHGDWHAMYQVEDLFERIKIKGVP